MPRLRRFELYLYSPMPSWRGQGYFLNCNNGYSVCCVQLILMEKHYEKLEVELLIQLSRAVMMVYDLVK
jgi:hypothetical protein